MLFSVALFSTLLLAPVVLAVPSGSAVNVYRNLAKASTRRNPACAAGALRTLYDWAGAIFAKGDGTFSTVTGTLTVPTFSGQNGSGAGFWTGLDGYSCTSSSFQSGVVATVENGELTYRAMYQWYPDNPSPFPDIKIFGGDVIKLTVATSSLTYGTATVENLTNGQCVSKSINSSIPLCGQNAEWLVKDTLDPLDNSFMPFADFGTVTFTNAKATGPRGEIYTPECANIVEIAQNNTVLTQVWINRTSVMIQHEPPSSL